MKVLALVLTAVMFGVIACESAPEPQPDTIVGVVADCPRGENFYSGTVCSGNTLQRYAYWLITVKTADGSTYNAKVDWDRKPRVGQKWP